MAAVQHVLIWNDGELKLHLRPVVRRGQLHQSALEFLEELDRFQRDFTYAMKDIGPPATVYSTSEDRLQHSGSSVPAEVTPVVRLCDGRRTLSDIIDESPFRVLDTVRIVGRLVELAILVRHDPKPDSDVRPARPPLDEFWENARIVGPSTPRPARARGDGSKTPTPQQGTPAVPATRGEANASGEEQSHPRRKTLEIIHTRGPPARGRASARRCDARALVVLTCAQRRARDTGQRNHRATRAANAVLRARGARAYLGGRGYRAD